VFIHLAGNTLGNDLIFMMVRSCIQLSRRAQHSAEPLTACLPDRLFCCASLAPTQPQLLTSITLQC